MSEQALVPVEQKQVAFYGDELTAVRANDEHVYVSIRHLCDALGIDIQAQTRRIRRQNVLANGFKGVANLATPGGLQTFYMLRVDLVPLWLAGIRTSAVREEIRPKLERYQEEAAKVLWEAFQEGRLTAEPLFDELLQSDSEAAQAYKVAMAVAKLARNQLLIEAKLSGWLDDHEQRLERIEAELGDPNRFVTPDQAEKISQAVKAIALALGKKTGKNEYGGVYGEMYRKFRVPGYREIPARRFREVMDWLNEWLQNVVQDSF